MRQAFAYEAVVVMDADADINALGAAVTVALCGHWEHPPPCPLAPHFSAATRLTGEDVQLRVLFVAEPDTEGVVRQRLDEALSHGAFTAASPDGLTRWQFRSSSGRPVRPDEKSHAERLAAG